MMIFLYLLLNFFVLAIHGSQNSVTVSLDAKWGDTPFVAEISEFLAAEDNGLFWRYLDSLRSLVADDKLAPTADAEVAYKASLEAARPLLSPGLLSLLELALASRAYSPAVERDQQLAASVRARLDAFPCPAATAAWALVRGRVACTEADLAALLGEGGSGETNATDLLLLLKTDKVFGGGAVREDGPPVAVLYADLRYKETYAAHALLTAASAQGRVQYVFRHRVLNVNTMKTRLSGYGVELAIKSTEYKAMDDTKITAQGGEDGKRSVEDRVAGFDFAVLRTLHPNLTRELDSFRQHLLESETEIVPLKAWQLQDLSYQAAQRIASAADPDGAALETLEDLSQNYPLRAHSLSKLSVSNSFRSDVQRLQNALEHQLGLGPGSSALFVNGFLLNDMDPISLLELLRREARVMEGLHSLGVSGTQINKVLRTQLSADSSGGSGAPVSKFALDIREMPVAYLNDLEDGSTRYYGWPTSVRSLLEQSFPGMLRRVAKNLFHLVLVVDPAEPDVWSVLRYAQAFVAHAAPVRIGLLWAVPKAEDSVGQAMVRAFNFVGVAEGEELAGLDFLIQVINEAEHDKTTGGRVTVALVRTHFEKRYSKSSAERVFGPGDEFRERLEEGRTYLASCGLSPRLPHVLLNGVPLDRRQVKDMFEETVVGYILEQTPAIQRDVYEGRLTDHMSTVDYLMSRPDVVPRLNQLILDPENNNFLSLGRRSTPTDVKPAALHADDLVARVADSLKYLSKKEDAAGVRPVSVWLAVDLGSASGRLAAYNALKVLRSSGKMRVAFVHVGPGDARVAGLDLTHAAHAAVHLLPPHTARLFVNKLVKEENVEELVKGTRSLRDLAVSDMDFDDFAKKMDAMPRDYKELYAAFGEKVLQLTKSAPSGVVVNGKVFGPLTDAQLFDAEDVKLLERVTLESAGAGALADRLASMKWPGQPDLSDLTMRASAILQAAGATPETSMASITSKRRFAPLDVSALSAASEAVVRMYGDMSQPAFELVAIVDPLTRDAQKMASVLRVLRHSINCNLHIVFNCKSKLSEAPLKTFYRLVWSPRPSDPSWGRAVFLDMPGTPLLTLGVDSPHAWMVAAVQSPYDLDNIRLSTTRRVSAHFELEHLLLEGHCVDTVTGQPPRGLQFTLGSRRGQADVDTIVMANLGYFQMKANPGAWFLQLRPGRSKDIYDISGHAYTDNMPDSPEVIAVIDSLRSKIIRVRVSKKLDKMDVNLLGDDDDAGSGMGAGLWSSISSAFGRSTKKKGGEGEVLNIFSVASGHLYERFLRIMMLSVLKHTKQPVKFWFLKNYLSPTFKDFIPHMAKAYNFEYELVQYKWPRWLHQQTEKQRIIWGYKILFLDVLFPLDVRKIIFVDADQIVRTDLQELSDLDLEGAPYGYTPFCDSRREMDGFRFWKSGYWAQHLGHRRYHISALYVVDLVRFRRLAAGDRLRGQYQGLSQDPNSLSNLDQDLPNNMIHQVPIKSLPQEWLWCETWCSTPELARAKTIDLCNNPLTKEPKLQAAMRIVPEWKDYDQEAKRLWDKVYGTKTADSGYETKPVLETKGKDGLKKKEEL